MTEQRTPTGLAAHNAIPEFASADAARHAIEAVSRAGVDPMHVSMLAPGPDAGDAEDVRRRDREAVAGHVLVGVHADDPATVDRGAEALGSADPVSLHRFEGLPAAD